MDKFYIGCNVEAETDGRSVWLTCRDGGRVRIDTGSVHILYHQIEAIRKRKES